MPFIYLQNAKNMLSQVMHKTLQSSGQLSYSEILQLNHTTAFHYWLTNFVHS